MPRATTRAQVTARALPASVVLVAAVAPVELALPAPVFGFTVTTVELTIIVALALGAAAWWCEPSSLRWRTPITLPLLALVAGAFAAALVAAELNGDAVRVAARYGVAVALIVLVANLAAVDQVARQIVAALLGAAAVVGVIAVLELAQWPWVLEMLKAFRPGFHVVGGQLRATSTLFYPTITSMFLEAAFALGLLWIGSSRLAFGALVLTGAGVIATFTRAGLITLTISMLGYGLLLLAHERRWRREHTRLIALAGALVVLVLISRSPQMLVARMSAEGSQEWYGATYDVPQRLTLRPDSFNDVPVTLTNDGRLTWQSSATPPFALSYHWLTRASEDVVIFDGLRTAFPYPVAPGTSVSMIARVRAPDYPGTYTLVWDVVQEHRTWLSLEGVYPGRSIATVDGPAAGAPPKTLGRMPSGVMRMPRSVLWSTALQISREHPWLGIGPDNFRHVYGRALGLAAWDSRVHANNSYLEVLVGMGAIGAASLIWLIVAAVRSTVRLLSDASPAALPIVAVSAVACLAIAAHAMVDSFLTFTPTYAIFAIAAGLLYAHRV
jgi:O-antigen ligase